MTTCQLPLTSIQETKSTQHLTCLHMSLNFVFKGNSLLGALHHFCWTDGENRTQNCQDGKMAQQNKKKKLTSCHCKHRIWVWGFNLLPSLWWGYANPKRWAELLTEHDIWKCKRHQAREHKEQHQQQHTGHTVAGRLAELPSENEPDQKYLWSNILRKPTCNNFLWENP